MKDKNSGFQEREIKGSYRGWFGLIVLVLVVVISIISMVMLGDSVWLLVPIFTVTIVFILIPTGLKTIAPNEAAVYTLFGNYYGTIKKPGFYWVAPFAIAVNPSAATWEELAQTSLTQGSNNKKTRKTSTKISLKATGLSNDKQKVNDSEGNPIEIGVIVIWRVVDPNKAVFEVDNYLDYISTQADGAIRQIARQYPYDVSEDKDDEKTLRGSSKSVSDELQREIQRRVDIAGIEILEARIAHLAYAPEIAAVMLQRQQATAIIEARQKIVEGAVGMVHMALEQLEAEGVVDLDPERKAQMVSNLLVILCGNKDAQPIVNSGSMY